MVVMTKRRREVEEEGAHRTCQMGRMRLKKASSSGGSRRGFALYREGAWRFQSKNMGDVYAFRFSLAELATGSTAPPSLAKAEQNQPTYTHNNKSKTSENQVGSALHTQALNVAGPALGNEAKIIFIWLILVVASSFGRHHHLIDKIFLRQRQRVTRLRRTVYAIRLNPITLRIDLHLRPAIIIFHIALSHRPASLHTYHSFLQTIRFNASVVN